jgi:hypothetical protein
MSNGTAARDAAHFGWSPSRTIRVWLAGWLVGGTSWTIDAKGRRNPGTWCGVIVLGPSRRAGANSWTAAAISSPGRSGSIRAEMASLNRPARFFDYVSRRGGDYSQGCGIRVSSGGERDTVHEAPRGPQEPGQPEPILEMPQMAKPLEACCGAPNGRFWSSLRVDGVDAGLRFRMSNIERTNKLTSLRPHARTEEAGVARQPGRLSGTAFHVSRYMFSMSLPIRIGSARMVVLPAFTWMLTGCNRLHTPRIVAWRAGPSV